MSFSGRRVSILRPSNRRFSQSKGLSENGWFISLKACSPSSSYLHLHLHLRTDGPIPPRATVRDPSPVPNRPRGTPSPRRPRCFPCLDRCSLVHRASHRTRLRRGSLQLGQSGSGCSRSGRRDRGKLPPTDHNPHYLCCARVRPDRRYQAVARRRCTSVQ